MIENNHDWKIHKILDETRRVYVYPARGNNKVQTQLELYAELMEQGKEVMVLRSADLPKKDPFKIHHELLDMHLICNIEPYWLQDAIDKHFEEEMKKYLKKDRENWKPKVYMSTSLLHGDWYNKRLGVMDSVLGSFIVAEDD